MSIVKKVNNFEYAPGIGTYGVNGKDGVHGESGTSIFISVYNVAEDGGAKSFAESVRYSYDMSSNEKVKLSRPYKNGDCFVIQSTADIYKITDVDEIIKLFVYTQTNVETLSKCIKLVGSIKSTNDNSGFNESDGRLVLDTTQFKGFVINTSNSEATDVIAPLTIISTTSDNNNNIHFIAMNGINQQTNTLLKIYYDTDNGCYFLESDTPVIVDADLKVKYNETVDFDGYSRVMTSSDTNNKSLSSFYSFCQNIYFKLGRQMNNEIFTGNLFIEFFAKDGYDINHELSGQMIHCYMIEKKNGKENVIREFHHYPVDIKAGNYFMIDISSDTALQYDENGDPIIGEELGKGLYDIINGLDSTTWNKNYKMRMVIENATTGVLVSSETYDEYNR